MVTDGCQPEVEVTKRAVGPDGSGVTEVTPGGEFTFAITVKVPDGYVGPDAENVTLDDVLPEGFVPFRSWTEPAGVALCTTRGQQPTGGQNLPSGELICRIPGLASNPLSDYPDEITIYVTGWIDPALDTDTATNTATALVPPLGCTFPRPGATPPEGCDPDTPTGEVEVDVVPEADLEITKTPLNSPVEAGGQAEYLITATNAGPSGAVDAVIVDRMPDGFTFASATVPDGAECAVDAGWSGPPVPPTGTGELVVCHLGDMAPGEVRSVQITANVDPRYIADSGTPDAPSVTVTNTAVVGSPETPDPTCPQEVTDCNTDTGEVEVVQHVDLAIVGSVSTTTPVAGQEIVYTATVTNDGPSAALDTWGDTTFPPGFVPISYNVPFNSCTWSPALPYTPPAAGSDARPWEDVPWSNTAYTLHCEPTVPGAYWEPGGTAMNSVTLWIPEDTPANTTADSYPSSSCVYERDGDPADNTTRPGAPTGAPNTIEELFDNNCTGVPVFVGHTSDVEIVKELVEPDPMEAGRDATWLLTVTNHGPSVADNVLVSDQVPDGMRYVAAAPEQGECAVTEEIDQSDGDSHQFVKCQLGTLEVDQTTTIRVTFHLDFTAPVAEENVCNGAIVGSSSMDPNAGTGGGTQGVQGSANASNNEDQACGAVVLPAQTDVGIVVQKDDHDVDTDVQQVRPGQRAAFTVTVTNHGGELATNVQARLTFDEVVGATVNPRVELHHDTPGDAEYSDYTGIYVAADSTYTAGQEPPPDGAPGSLTFDIGAMNPGDTVVYVVDGVVAGAPQTTLLVVGTVTHGPEPDSNPDNDTDVHEVLLVTEPGPPPAPDETMPPRSPLPMTGARIIGLVVVALVALAAGVGLRKYASGRHPKEGPGAALE